MQTQALMQLSALIITLVVALVGGAFTGKSKILTHTRVDGTGGAEGAQAPPPFLDLYSKNFKNS